MTFPVRTLNGLGVVADRKRNIKPGTEFDAYFPRPEYSDPLLNSHGTNEMTIDRYIPRMVVQYLKDTGKIAVVLKQASLEATLKSIFDFIYGHIQYKQDSPFEEQIRRPARSWADRKSGVDCDCYTTFISSILTNLRIPHYLRMAAYNPARGFQHIYVIVPKKEGGSVLNRKDYFAVDPVLNRFDDEKPFIKKRDRFMGVARALNGFNIRMLNGDVAFDNKNNWVYDRIFYSPGMKTWALKGLDGGFYIQGDPNKRFIEPLQGIDGLGFVDTGIGVDGFLKKIGGAVKKGVKSAAKGVTKLAKTALPIAANFIPGGGAALSIASGLLSSGGGGGSDSSSESVASASPMMSLPGASNFSQVNSLPFASNFQQSSAAQASGGNNNEVVSKIVAANKANIMSLNTLNDGMKTKLNQFSDNISTDMKKVVDNGQSIQDATSNLKNLALTSLNTTANLKQQTSELNNQSTQMLELMKAEQIKSEQFRTEQVSTNRITLISLIALGVLLVIITVKKSNH